MRDNITVLKTILIHADSGEQLESELTIRAITDPQKLGAAMTQLNLPSRTIGELVQRHFGSEYRINSMTPAEFIQLLTLMRQTATLTTHTNHQTNGVVRENVRS